jgi:hypothetical protein
VKRILRHFSAVEFDSKIERIFFLGGYAIVFLIGGFHLAVHSPLLHSLSPRFIAALCIISGISLAVGSHVLLFKLWLRAFPKKTHGTTGVQHVIPVESSVIKVIFSSENEGLHERIVPMLRSAFNKHTTGKVEIVSKKTAQETLFCVTDNVVDLVILGDEFTSGPLNAKALFDEIKKLDRNIPVVIFRINSDQEFASDGWYEYPRAENEVRPLATYLHRR